MELAYGCMDAMLNSGWLPAWMPAKMVPVAMRHDAVGSWLVPYRRSAGTVTYGRALMGRASRENISWGLGGIYSLSVVTMVALAWRGWGSWRGLSIWLSPLQVWRGAARGQ